MPIYPTHNAVFVHIPKTGGSTITTLLKRNQFLGMKSNQIDQRGTGETIFELLDVLGADADRYFKFTFVRNPWDRLISAYHYVVQRRPELGDVTSHSTFEDFVSALSDDPQRYLSIRYFRPQWSYLSDEQGNSPIDFVGRFERFEDDLQKALTHIGFRRFLMRHRKRSKRSDYRDYYDDQTREMVGEVYSRDIEMFGYAFEDGQVRKNGLLIKRLRAGTA